MAVPPAWEIIRQLRQQKLGYYQNALTDEALWQNLLLTYDTLDFATFLADLTLSDTLFSSLMLNFTLDLSLDEIVPINLNWSIELPTIDQFLQGVLILLVPINLEELVPDLSDVIANPALLLEDAARQALEETKLRKCIYGYSTYGNCYVDPSAFREFIRSTILAFTKKWYDFRTARDMIVAAAKALNIKPEVVEDLFNRLSMIYFAKFNCATWDYAFWDSTFLCEERTHSPEVGILRFLDFNLKEVAVEYQGLFDSQAGCIWDVSFWDMCFWLDDTPGKESPYIPGDDRIVKLQDALVFNFRTRYLATAYALANYQRPEERRYPFNNERMEIYAQSRAFSIDIEATVKNIVQSLVPGIDPVTLRFYIDAALELYGLSTPHKWGLEMQRSMAREELKKYWLEKYSQMGLDPNVLEAIWSAVKTKIDAYSDKRVQNRLKFLSRRLRLVK